VSCSVKKLAFGAEQDRREMGDATVYQKHRSLLSRKTMYRD
jgi:hypothetical protein